MPHVFALALAAALFSGCGQTAASSVLTVSTPMPLARAPIADVTTPDVTPDAPSASPDSTLYPSAAVTDTDRDAVLIRDLDALGITPVGAPEADVLALFGTPDSDDTYDLDVDFPGGEMRVEVFNTTRDREARGEDVHVRELRWTLPNGWVRYVWLHDAADGWAVADGREWAADRVDF